jgi:hypothetical protein
MDLREIWWGGIDWIDLTQDRDQWRALVNTIMNLRVPKNIGKFLNSCTTGDFSRKAHIHPSTMRLHAPASLIPGNSNRYPLDRRLNGPQSRYGRCELEKNPLLLPGLETPVVDTAVSRYTNWASPAPSLKCTFCKCEVRTFRVSSNSTLRCRPATVIRSVDRFTEPETRVESCSHMQQIMVSPPVGCNQL